MLPIISAGFHLLTPILCGGLAVRDYFADPDKIRNSIRNPIQENNIREVFRSILEKNGIRNDIQFRLDSNKFAFSMGGNFTKYATIFICPEFREIDEAAFQFAVKHEIGHIKNNDVMRPTFLAMIASIAMAILFPYVLGTSIIMGIASFALNCFTSLVIYGLVVRYREMKADDFAIANASNEELSGAVRLFKTLQNLDEEKHDDPLHPSTLSRIEKCEQELRKRGQVYTNALDDFLKRCNIRRLVLGHPRLTLNNIIEAIKAERAGNPTQSALAH